MKKDDYLDLFHSQEKAIDHAFWLNFKYRIAGITFGVIHAPNGMYAVCEETTTGEMEVSFLDILPKHYKKMSYDQIRHIRMEQEPLPHWGEIIGMISTMNGEILRYILSAKIPLEKFIRHELASRGYDKNHRWCGFEKANAIWLKE